MLLVGRSQDRFSVVSLGIFFRGSFLQNHVPWGRLSLWKWVPGISPGVKAVGVFDWRPTTLVVPMIRGLNLPGTPRATSACCGVPLLYLLSRCRQKRILVYVWSVCYLSSILNKNGRCWHILVCLRFKFNEKQFSWYFKVRRDKLTLRRWDANYCEVWFWTDRKPPLQKGKLHSVTLLQKNSLFCSITRLKNECGPASLAHKSREIMFIYLFI